MNLIERGVDIARRQVDADNAHDVDKSFSFFEPGFRTYLNGVLDPTDTKGMKAGATALYAAIPDFTGTVEWLDGTDDFLVHQWSFKGTFSGQLGPLPPTGRSVEMHGCTVMQHDGEHFSCFWRSLDNPEFARWLRGEPRSSSTDSAARDGGNMPFGSSRDAAERAGANLALRLVQAEQTGNTDALLELFDDPIVEGIWGKTRRHSHAVVARDASRLPIGSNRAVHQRLAIGDRVVERFTATRSTPDGSVQSEGCIVFEHDGTRFTRIWSYFDDYDRIRPGIYEELE